MAKNQSREIKKVIDLAVGRGCVYTPGNRGRHGKLVVPGKGVVTVSGTPSDRNAHRQVMRDLRRLGIDLF